MPDGFYFLKIDGKVQKYDYPYNNDKNSSNEVWKNIPASQFLSVNEIAEHQLEQLTCEQLLSMSKMEKKELIGLHFTYGMWMRNSYGLWHPNNPFIIKDDLGDGHPDGLSMLVIEEIHKRLTTFVPTSGRVEASDAFQDAMSIVQEK